MPRASRSRSRVGRLGSPASLPQLLLGPGRDVARYPSAVAAITMITVPVTVDWVTTPRTARSQAADERRPRPRPSAGPLTTETASTGQAIQMTVSVGSPRDRLTGPTISRVASTQTAVTVRSASSMGQARRRARS